MLYLLQHYRTQHAEPPHIVVLSATLLLPHTDQASSGYVILC